MGKSCLDGYLTDGCASCPDWADGSNNRGIGCACHHPISWCPHFSAMWEKREYKNRPHKGNKVVVQWYGLPVDFGSIGLVIDEINEKEILVQFKNGIFTIEKEMVRRATKHDF